MDSIVRPPHLPSKYARKTPIERLWRRREVETSLEYGWTPEVIEEALSKKYQVTPRVIRDDVRLAYEAWGKASEEVRDRRRSALTRRLDRIARVAEAAGRFNAAIKASVVSAMLHGLVPLDPKKGLGTLVGPLTQEDRDSHAPPSQKAQK
jgi:hypothetical protein